jgi:RES domain-containing protein
MKALCTSLRFETPWLEARQAFPFKARPMTLCAYDVDCGSVLDLTDPVILVTHGVEAAELAYAWKDMSTPGIRSPTWEIARRLIVIGTAGVGAGSTFESELIAPVTAVRQSMGCTKHDAGAC